MDAVDVRGSEVERDKYESKTKRVPRTGIPELDWTSTSYSLILTSTMNGHNRDYMRAVDYGDSLSDEAIMEYDFGEYAVDEADYFEDPGQCICTLSCLAN
jgi:hypothetical protein